ncbi:hypothetical protein D1818_19235 [Aquimarina sp. BL5]|nr:hypothetical protein D1818_19235 [Aquimarina sp. BL5]RKN07523.1 hypothetical protein D7036_07510 [Aquimarina sp. BL5]
MMKTIKILFILISSAAIVSCSSDDSDASGTTYPITLNFANVSEDFTFFQNGAETAITDEALNSYNSDTNISLSKEEFEVESANDYFKFLSDTEVEVSEGGEVFTVDYVFEEGFLYLLEDNDKFLYGQGDKTALAYRLSALVSVRENGSSGASGGYEDADDVDFFPATFENSVDFHNYSTVDEIQGDNYLLIHNLSINFQ